MTISQLDATSSTELASRAPSCANWRSASSPVSKTVNEIPPSIRRRARRPPILPTPIKPTLPSDISSLLKPFTRDSEAIDSRLDAAIDRNLQEDFFDLVFRQTVRQRASPMRADLVRSIER